MKKFIVSLLLSLVVVFTFTGCNRELIDLNYHYNYALIKIKDEWVEFEIKSWNDYEGEQLQITLKDGRVLLVSSINCILMNKSYNF